MAQKLIYIGSFGPFIFDDAELTGDELMVQQGVYTDSSMRAAKVSSDGDLEGNLQGFNEALKKSFLL